MTNKLILIDGSSLLSTSFFGNVPNTYLRAKTDAERDLALEKVLKTEDGQYTNGVFTMMKLFEKLIKQQNPSHMVVAWDVSRDTFRRTLYPEYKAQRAETRPELKTQFGLAQEVLKAMNIPQFVVDGYEADDIIGTLSKRFNPEIPVYIWTKDQDAIQLVDDQTRLWLITSKAKERYEELGIDRSHILVPDNAFEFTPHYVKEYYGIHPNQMIDLKGICGDTSDNIPGVKGVGEKSVIPLLAEFETLEGIYDYIESAEEKEMKAFFKELGIARSPYAYLMKASETELVGKASALLSKQLATIHCEMDALKEVALHELELSINHAGREDIYRKLAFKSLLATK
jgi:5'-3' exonuclease